MEGVYIEAHKAKIVTLIPAYNEERFIGSVVLKALQYSDEVIVVDDGSADDTAAVAEAAGAIVIRHKQNAGKGAALNSGLRAAREIQPKVLALLDGDGQHRPRDIPAMIDPILNDEADMVVGSRYLDLDSDIPSYRRLGQHTITLMTNLASGVSSTDSWSGFRAFNQRAINCIRFREGGWGVDPEFQFQANANGLRVSEVPIVALYEEKAKRNPLPHGIKTVNAILRMTGQHRPLFYNGIIGLILIILGLLMGVRVVILFQSSRQLATGSAVISMLLIVVGTIFISTGIMLHAIRAQIKEIKTMIGAIER